VKGDAVLFVGDDWAEDHHDIEIVDEAGQRLVKRRLAEGPAGLSTLHALIADHLPEPAVGEELGAMTGQVKVGIETDRGPWVAALVSAGYEVFAINPMQVARYRQRHSTSGAKSDAADAHLLVEIVRLDREHHRRSPATPRRPRRSSWSLVRTRRRSSYMAPRGAGPGSRRRLVAWDRVRSNKGARSAGVDGFTAYAVEARGAEEFLDRLRSHLKDRSFCPVPVRERMIPKAGGKKRRLGIATVTDRVVQASMKLVLEPIFEADFLPCSYGFRPNRRAHDAVAEVRYLAARPRCYEWGVEGDIKACFDEISHPALMDRGAGTRRR
jgi:Transposase/Reverse transcriptase (RNA-dependent DNA polymerase)